MQKTVRPDTRALVIDNVSKIYTQWQRSGKIRDIVKNLIRPEQKEVRALDGISLEVKHGEFLAYAGANGAGKSTTIKILSGILQPTDGEVRVLGRNPAQDRIELMKHIGVLFGQRTELWWDHPIITSYQWKKAVWNIPQEVYERNLAMVTELLDLGDILHTFARELSLGQRMRADLGMLLLHEPEVIFLDEPTLGLDVLAKRQMIEFLKRYNREKGTTIVVTSHDMDDLEEMADRIILLSKGKIAFDGGFDTLRQVQGGLCRVNITTGDGRPPVLEGMNYIRSDGNVHVFEYDRSQNGMGGLLGTLAHLDNIEDIEIRKAPIEEVIANLYQSWKNPSAEPA
ncbi:MAG TPA: ATP-binding cassette domain-containing protein [Caproiciproducens sp.]|nr:ATP-binding cassette domain-containing protein [Caproiciproducens sp.]